MGFGLAFPVWREMDGGVFGFWFLLGGEEDKGYVEQVLRRFRNGKKVYIKSSYDLASRIPSFRTLQYDK